MLFPYIHPASLMTTNGLVLHAVDVFLEPSRNVVNTIDNPVRQRGTVVETDGFGWVQAPHNPLVSPEAEVCVKNFPPIKNKIEGFNFPHGYQHEDKLMILNFLSTSQSLKVNLFYIRNTSSKDPLLLHCCVSRYNVSRLTKFGHDIGLGNRLIGWSNGRLNGSQI